jgi:hypothetical protein
VQIDEPILVTELDAAWQAALATAYDALKASRVRCRASNWRWPCARKCWTWRRPACA